MTALARYSTPYKGPDSYQVEDAALFFGRGRDAERLGSSILSSRLTLLHAQSGAGKTSLLNAEVIPALETKGWIAVRVLPQNDPVASVWVSTLGYVLPPARSEYLAIKRIRDELSALDENPTLGELLARYDDLPMRDPRKRSLISPIEAADIPDAPARVQCANFTPYVCRLFRSTCDLQGMAEHFDAIMSFSDMPRNRPFELRNDTPVGDLVEFCRAPVFARAYAALISTLDAPNPRLRELLQNLVDVYGNRRTLFSLVIVLDQFEELFTRFVDLGSLAQDRQVELPDWRLKYEFFDQLRELYLIEPNASTAEQGALPIRYVISMRSEYIAQLDPIRAFAPELDVESFRLELLDQEGARQAIQSPAEEYGFGYTDDCYEAIALELTKEERFVEPAHVQIVCQKLWAEEGKALSEEALRAGTGDSPEGVRKIGIELYRDRLHGAAGIMRSFLRDFLDALDESARLETLELLEPLITGSGTRNIIERGTLIAAPFRPQMHRERLLANLVARTIARIETRLGGQFVEITHEFLIPPIREAMQKDLYSDVEYTRCRVALRMLGRLQQTYADSEVRPSITSGDFNLLNRYRDRIEWNDWAVALMFREAVRHGVAHDETRFWADRFRKSAGSPARRASGACGGSEGDVAVGAVREYLASPNEGERRNALKALAALRSKEAADALIAISLDPHDTLRRDAALAELVRFGDGINDVVAGVLGDGLGDPARTRGIYALLGRLRRSGSPIAVDLPRKSARLRLGLSLFSQLYPKGKRKPWSRSIKAAGIGGFLLTALLAAPAYLGLAAARWFELLAPKQTGFVYGVPFMIVLAGMFATPAVSIVTRRASPFPLHYDRKAGKVSEILWAAVGAFYVTAWSLLLGLLIATSVMIDDHLFSQPSAVATRYAYVVLWFAMVGTVSAVFPIAVRYGSMREGREGKAPSRISRIVWGTLWGLIALAAIVTPTIYFLRLANPVANTENFVVGALALIIAPLPVITGLAYAYVTIDDEDVIKA